MLYFGVISFILVISSHNALCYTKSYRNFALLHGTPQNVRELKFFNDMVKVYNVTFWRRPGKVKKPVEFTISPFGYGELMLHTQYTKIRFKTVMEDVQSAFDRQTVRHYTRREINSFNWGSYFGLDDIYNWLKDLTVVYPEEVQLKHIGKSFENRDIFAVKLTLSKEKNIKKRHRPKVIVEGGCHGREWISPTFVTYMIFALLNANHSNSEQLKLVASMYDWSFVPVMNPDGYVYSQTSDRLWKKNRRGGYGVDLNRNFGIMFGKPGNREDKKSEEYCGKEAFSEPESSAMAAFARDNSFNLQYYLSFHAYGQYIILPYAFSKEHEDNYNSTKKLADMAAIKMFRKYNIKYEVGTYFDTQGYLASGVSTDWVKRAINVTHVVSFKLPDTGVFGIALPPERILPTCQATMDGLLDFLYPPKVVTKLKILTDGAALKKRVSDEVFLFCNVLIYIRLK